METSNSPQLLTIYQVAAMLGVSTKTVRRIVKDGELPLTKIRGSYRFRQVDIEKYVSENTTDTMPSVATRGHDWTSVDNLR